MSPTWGEIDNPSDPDYYVQGRQSGDVVKIDVDDRRWGRGLDRYSTVLAPSLEWDGPQ